MDITVISQLIGQVGFPIFVAVYVLVRLDQQLDGIKTELTRLNDRASVPSGDGKTVGLKV
jgi:hypothetical protein